ncbi:hypothetical protein GCM10010909_35400 [Acidocella aquatica]|uniref:ROK family protein n=1 Tax=Acidocella aquatica TaxID=1922313 RepID=A0ABQ6ABB6_9PROT|nr:ROK family protein [Acidocella aquatica]GLR68858.1 hypothetical protein GCM10010909_35400 [Acidocella aquatica]
MTDDSHFRILAIDIGGTNLKAALLDADGRIRGDPLRCATPPEATPALMLEALSALIAPLGDYDRISIGFPGAIRRGIILTAPNIGTTVWHGTDFSALATAYFGRPTRLANDAMMHGLGVITGEGIELVLTLGTGMGFSLFRDGVPAPQIELGRHPADKAPTYDELVGDAALRQLGMVAWKIRVQDTISRCAALVNFDVLHLGGGNARHFEPVELPAGVRLAVNAAGLMGGVKLWHPAMDVIFT